MRINDIASECQKHLPLSIIVTQTNRQCEKQTDASQQTKMFAAGILHSARPDYLSFLQPQERQNVVHCHDHSVKWVAVMRLASLNASL